MIRCNYLAYNHLDSIFRTCIINYSIFKIFTNCKLYRRQHKQKKKIKLMLKSYHLMKPKLISCNSSEQLATEFLKQLLYMSYQPPKISNLDNTFIQFYKQWLLHGSQILKNCDKNQMKIYLTLSTIYRILKMLVEIFFKVQ